MLYNAQGMQGVDLAFVGQSFECATRELEGGLVMIVHMPREAGVYADQAAGYQHIYFARQVDLSYVQHVSTGSQFNLQSVYGAAQS